MMQRLRNWLLSYLYPTVDPLKVITVAKNGSVYLNAELITDTELKNLQAEIQALKNFKIWDIMQNTVKDHAQQTMFKNSKDFEDIKSGKMMLYNLDVQNRIIENIEKGRVH